ncbi:14736_t:CDS:2, partial [Entrophospora sp. SA101]
NNDSCQLSQSFQSLWRSRITNYGFTRDSYDIDSSMSTTSNNECSIPVGETN